jgi:hypothetical protein
MCLIAVVVLMAGSAWTAAPAIRRNLLSVVAALPALGAARAFGVGRFSR